MKDQLFEISGKFLGGRKGKEHSYVPERADGHLERYKKLMDAGEYMQMAFEKSRGGRHPFQGGQGHYYLHGIRCNYGGPV